MVNEERVKQLYKIAIYEQTEEKHSRQTGLYYRSDYIGKEIVKSFFTGSIAYMIMSLKKGDSVKVFAYTSVTCNVKARLTVARRF